MNSHDISNRWVPCGYHVGTMWNHVVPVSGCQISGATVPMLRSLELPRIEGLKVGMPKDLLGARLVIWLWVKTYKKHVVFQG